MADTCSHAIRAVQLSTGEVTTLCGDGYEGPCLQGAAAAEATFNFPEGCAIDPSGDVWIVDTDNDCVRVLRRAAERVDQVSLSGEPLSKPEGVLQLPGGELLLVSDTCNHRLVTVSTITGVVAHLAGSRSGVKGSRDGPLDSALFRAPRGLAITQMGQLVIADKDNECLRVIDQATGTVRTVDVELRGPFAVTVNSVGDLITAEFDKNRVTVLSNKLHVLKVALMTSSHVKRWPREVLQMLYNTRTW